MNEQENNNLAKNDENAKYSFVFDMGTEAKNKDGKDVSADQFVFVQNNKKISDVKFTTKPTTFLKDAMRRFTKNQSSVVGGIILGILFALAIILPINGVLPYDTTSVHNYETNMPMKLFSAGNGVWDGTRVYDDQEYPYQCDADGNLVLDENGDKIYIGTYPSDSVIVSILSDYMTYVDHSATDGQGGYAKIAKNIKSQDVTTDQLGYMYCYPYTFDFSNDYTMTYTLGTCADSTYSVPDYAIVVYYNGMPYALTEYTSDYGENYGTAGDGAMVNKRETKTVNLNDLMDHSVTELPAGIKSQAISFGFAIKAKEDSQTALFIKECEFNGTKTDGSALAKKERTQLKSRSFGTENSSIADANTLVQQSPKKSDDSTNYSYWTSITDTRFDSVDTYIHRCSILYDEYEKTYGLRRDMQIPKDTFDKWIDKGYITYDYTADDPASTYSITEAGEASGEVYVKEVESQIASKINDETSYTMFCVVLMYKYLGYDSMPIHLFGTDYQGKDLLKYVFSGLRTSLILGFVVAAINIVIGVIWGSISGYFGGTPDIIMERITDILGGIPWIVLMTVLTLKLGTNFFVFALSLCLTGWIGTASVTRSQFYRYRGREYVLASKTLGAKSPRLIFRHILPNAIGTIVTSSILMVPSTIFSEATISYLGLGLQNLDSLGVILSQNQKVLSTYPSQLVFPAIIISLLLICFNLFGNGLRDAFNPSLKGTD